MGRTDFELIRQSAGGQKIHMNPNRTIRIIKGAERNNQQSAEKSPAVSNEAKGQPARATAAAGVASWVKEFRQRRRPDPHRAFASLFGEQTAPLNSLT
jgi:hypothetical protein